MRFIEIFTSWKGPDDLKKQVNQWIAEHKVNIVDVKFTAFGHGSEVFSVLVIYEADEPVK